MPGEGLGERDQSITLQCMKAVSVLIEEWEMPARLGLSAAELQALISRWPCIDSSNQKSTAFLATNNSLNEICNGLAVEEWASLIDATRDEVQRVYQSWLALHSSAGGIR